MSENAESSPAKTVCNVLRNPLVVFGLILVAGDGPLTVAYSLTSDAGRATVLMWGMISFIFIMGTFFCYLVAFKPRHLYAPGEIPERAIGKALYHDPQPSGTGVLEEAQDLVQDLRVSDDAQQRQSLADNINVRLKIANEVQAAYELLLIPGYDITLIEEILDTVDRYSVVDRDAIARPRNITPTTITTILSSMESRGYITTKQKRSSLTERGTNLRDSLTEYLWRSRRQASG